MSVRLACGQHPSFCSFFVLLCQTLQSVAEQQGDAALVADMRAASKQPRVKPLLVFEWQNTQLTIAQIPALPEPPFALPANLTETAFRQAFMDFVRDPLSARFGSTGLLCTYAQYGMTIAEITKLPKHPFFAALNATDDPAGLNDNALPILTVYVKSRARRDELERVMTLGIVPIIG